MTTQLISTFTPSLMKPETLEALFVQREGLAERTVELVRESVLTDSKHHTLLVGPRGIGKTHFVSLVYYRLLAMEDIRDRMIIAWLREEEWGISSFLDLLLRILRALVEADTSGMLQGKVDSLFQLSAEEAERAAVALFKELLADRTLLLIAENLQDIFRGLEDAGQKKLRAFIQENPFITIVATSQSLFNGVSSQTQPFYGFFRVRHLQELTLEDATDLLANIARFKHDDKLAEYIMTAQGRARVRAIYHMAGGNHRIYVILSEFLTQSALDDVVEPFMGMIDDLTPYYQERMRHLSPQQRKIVEILCDAGNAMAVKDIAQRTFMAPQSASSQLTKLREWGYVNSRQSGRESYYELHEPLMRLAIEVKKNRGGPIRLIIDFLRLWFLPKEMENRLNALDPDALLEREYILCALRIAAAADQDPRLDACESDCIKSLSDGDFETAIRAVNELVALRGELKDWYYLSTCLEQLGRDDEAIDASARALECQAVDAADRLFRGRILGRQGRHEEAVTSMVSYTNQEPHDGVGWYVLGRSLFHLDRIQEAAEALDTATQLAPEMYLPWVYFGLSLIEKGDLPEAETALLKAVDLVPNNHFTWELAGWAYLKSGHIDKSLESFSRVIKLAPEPALSAEIAEEHILLGYLDSALVIVETSLLTNESYAPLWYLRGGILLGLGRNDSALDSLEKSIKFGDERRETQILKALVLSAMDRADDAAAIFTKSDSAETSEGLRHTFLDMVARIVVQRSFRLHMNGEGAAGWTRRMVDGFKAIYCSTFLGRALVGYIPKIRDKRADHEVLCEWLEVWKRAATDDRTFTIPLQMLSAAVEYLESRNPVALLELPSELRRILQPLLGLEVDGAKVEHVS